MAAATAVIGQLLNGLTIGIVFVLLAAGLSVIFGVMDVINFAHGELFTLGAYLAFALALAVGSGGFWLALFLAPVAVALVGVAMEQITLRPLYGRNPLYHILLTFGLVLIFKDVIEFIWGPQSRQFPTPELLAGPVEVLGFSYPLYNYFVIVVGGLLAAGTWLWLNYTRYGLIVRAGSQDREMVEHLGIDVDRYYTLVFAVGAGLAAFGGIVLAGRQGLAPSMGDGVIIPAFVIVVLGGLGSFRGAVVGGLLVGVIQTFTRSPPVFANVIPDLEGLVVFLLMIAILLLRPQGLYGRPEWESGGDESGELLTGAGGSVIGERLTGRLGVVLVLALVIAPFGIGALYSSYLVNTLLINTLVWALFALSIDFVMGYAGLVSLGHALFFGLGAYSTVIVTTGRTPVIGSLLATAGLAESVFVALGIGMLVAAAVAWVVGYLSIRVTGVYFAMITLGFAELFRSAVVKVPWTGSTDGIFGLDPVYGIFGVTIAPLFGTAEVGNIDLFGGETELFYYFVLAAVVGSYLVARRLIRSPFGSVLVSIRENEQRTSFLGYDVTAYKRRAFVVSGALASLAGGLSAINTGGVGPSFLHWIRSGEVIVMTILGGMGTLYGPMLGAGVFFGAKEVLLAYTEQWQGVLGVLFVFFVIFAPRGLVSLPDVIAARFDSYRGGGGITPAETTGGSQSAVPKVEEDD
jgi:branched-chain amino acid transport system permease protein